MPPPEAPKDDAEGKEKEKTSEAEKKEPIGPDPFKEIRFAYVFGDESEPFCNDPEDSLKADKPGWGALPRIDRPRHAVFVPAEAETFQAGATLRILMKFWPLPQTRARW